MMKHIEMHTHLIWLKNRSALKLRWLLASAVSFHLRGPGFDPAVSATRVILLDFNFLSKLFAPENMDMRTWCSLQTYSAFTKQLNTTFFFYPNHIHTGLCMKASPLIHRLVTFKIIVSHEFFIENSTICSSDY